MRSFNRITNRILLSGALLLAGGVYYQDIAAQWVEEARMALRGVQAAQSQLLLASESAREYNSLLAGMADSNVDRQEPFAVVSEFSPQEIKQIGPLLDKLYQRDGYFFLEHFQLAWQKQPGKAGLPPRVVMDLEGRKVLLFSNEAGHASPFVVASQ